MRILAWLVYIPLQILFIPLTLVGFGIVAYKQLVVSKRLGASSTGIEVLNGRWTMHVFGVRDDEPTARMAEVIPNTSLLGLWLFLLPLWVKYRLSGTHFAYPRIPPEGDEAMMDIVVARTLYVDRILARVLPGMEQFVLLGAGYDSRAYGELKREGLAFLELDQAGTQRLKIDTLEKAGIDTSHVSFVTVDFSREDAFDELVASGYDPTKKTVFLWEGVTLYLDAEDVRRTLREIREHSAPGSVAVLDVYAERMIRYAQRSYNRKALEYTNETMSFGLPFATDFENVLQSFIEGEGLRVGEAFFLGRDNKRGPYGVVAELRV